MRTMTKRKKDNQMPQHNSDKQPDKLVGNAEMSATVRNSVLTNEQLSEPQPRAFVPPACSSCTALRPAKSNYTRVYSIHGRTRYCRCGFCGNTYKVVE